jgi:hypothetical protein
MLESNLHITTDGYMGMFVLVDLSSINVYVYNSETVVGEPISGWSVKEMSDHGLWSKLEGSEKYLM